MTTTGCSRPEHELLDWYVNGTLAAEEEARVRLHLDGCDLCSDRVRDLTLLAGALAGEDRRTATGRDSRAALSRRALLWVAGAAAMLMIVAGLSTYRVSPGRTGPDTSVMTFDLGSGSMRGSGSEPAISIPRGTRLVRISIEVPPMESASACYDLIGPDGATLVRAKPLAPRDDLGRYQVIVPVEMLETSGEYLILVHPIDRGAGESPSFTYVFRVAP